MCLIKIKLFYVGEGEDVPFLIRILELIRKVKLNILPKDMNTV